jgi:hypothetical protein
MLKRPIPPMRDTVLDIRVLYIEIPPEFACLIDHRVLPKQCP